jgi:hypothetical protein
MDRDVRIDRGRGRSPFRGRGCSDRARSFCAGSTSAVNRLSNRRANVLAVRTATRPFRRVSDQPRGEFSACSRPSRVSPRAASRGPDAIRTKADILTYARNSFAGGHRATAATRIENLIARMDNLPDSAHGETRLQMMMFAVRHGASHYGQMVEYLRMNGIVPPASRPPGQVMAKH